MKDIILDRLNKIEDLEQRKILKNIMTGVFTNLIDYQEMINNNIKERVFSEIEGIEENYNVYVTICDKNKVDPVDEFLYPIIDKDMEEKILKTIEIKEKLDNGESIKLFSIFMKCDYERIKELISSKKKYKGQLITNIRKHDIEIKLDQNRSYINEIEKLYDIFLKNNIPWKTINNPYANKFFDIILTDCETITEEEEIIEISFDLEEYEKYKVIDFVPLWNIRRLNIKSSGFPVPAVDKVNFEHSLQLKNIELGNGYLVNEEERLIKYIKLTKDELIIVSPEEKAGEWKVLNIIQPIEEKNEAYEYGILSNTRKNNFLNNYSKRQTVVIRTKGEIMRIINSFEISKYFKLVDVEIQNEEKSKSITYDMNHFIIDDIRVANEKKIMKLKFKIGQFDEFIICDILSFLVSEVQMYFPEYKCEGELI